MNWDRCHEAVSRKHELQPCDLTAVALRLDPEGGRPYPVCARHTRGQMVPLAMLLSSVTDKGAAVVESGLSVRQAHEIETGCTQNDPCRACLQDLT
jgi:hypothetical protein